MKYPTIIFLLALPDKSRLALLQPSFFHMSEHRKECVSAKIRNKKDSKRKKLPEKAWVAPGFCKVTLSQALICFYILGRMAKVCLLASFLPASLPFFLPFSLFPFKERVYSVAANIDLEMREQECTFEKISSSWRFFF